jgi:hypothetical protein
MAIKTFLKRVVSTLFMLTIFSCFAEASFILHNEGILTKKTSDIVEKIGTELKEKTGITVYLSAKKTLNKKHIHIYGKELSDMFKDKPHAIILFAQYDKKVDTASTPDVRKMYDEDKVLDRTTDFFLSFDKNSENTKYNAGLLTGYSELCEQIAKSKSVTLESALGNESANVVGTIRVIIYGMIVVFGLYYLYLKIFRRKNG